MFNFLRKCGIIFHRGCTILYSYQKSASIPISLHSHQHLIFSVFKKYIATLVGVKWYLIVVLICVSLVTDDTKHLSTLAICTSSLEKCLFKSWFIFNWIVCLLVFEL